MKEHGEPTQDQPRSPGRDSSDGMNQGMRVLSYLISGVLVYGLLGWLGDHYLGTGFLLPIGILSGAGFGVYIIVRRFGHVDEETIAELSALRRKQAAGRPSAIGVSKPAPNRGVPTAGMTSPTEDGR
jgi:ATP synthase protein I